MRDRTRLDVDEWWRGVFGVETELWSAVTVLHPHGQLDDYEGWYVAWRDEGVHVSAPSSADGDDVASLRTRPATAMSDPEFWRTFADDRGLQVIGPSTHFYLDVDIGTSVDVVALSTEQLGDLETRVRPEEWSEGGMADDPPAPVAFGVVADGGTVAGAVLNDWRGVPSDLGVVVASSHRGRGLATTVGRHAASYAVRQHGIARWRAATSNVASMRAARGLGFEPYATQLAVRRGSSGV